MKKSLILVLILSLVLVAFAGCGGGEEPPADVDTTAAVMTGLAVMTDATRSVAATAEEEGVAEAYSEVVAVTVDADGVIVNCIIDAAQTQIMFDNKGMLTSPMDSVFLGKLEKGDDYGMVGNSSISKEWYQQSDALSSFVIGMTTDDVKAIAVDDEGYPTDADLTTSVTMGVDAYLATIVKAVENAQDLGAQATDMIGVGLMTTMDKSLDATMEEAGNAQAYSMYAAVTFDADGVITSCILDGSQTNIGFDTMGAFTTDLAGPFQTKNELGDAYGMKEYGPSSIGKEWNEQAAFFADYVVGKTVEEVNGIALTEDGTPADADLSAGTTVHIGPFMMVIEKAYNMAK
jgi:hypothetical protein